MGGLYMVQPTDIQVEINAADTDAIDRKYSELIASLQHDKKNDAIKKYPELREAFKLLEAAEIYFLAGGSDEEGLAAFKSKMAASVISKLVQRGDLS